MFSRHTSTNSRISILKSSAKSSSQRLFSHLFKANSIDQARKKTVSIAEENLDYDIMPSEMLQNKVDYFITPYNKKLNLHKHMEFGKSLISMEEFLKFLNGESLEEGSKHK